MVECFRIAVYVNKLNDNSLRSAPERPGPRTGRSTARRWPGSHATTRPSASICATQTCCGGRESGHSSIGCRASVCHPTAGISASKRSRSATRGGRRAATTSGQRRPRGGTGFGTRGAVVDSRGRHFHRRGEVTYSRVNIRLSLNEVVREDVESEEHIQKLASWPPKCNILSVSV